MKRRCNSRGVSLVEIIISLVIFVTAVMPLSGFFVNMARVNSDSKIRAQANALAMEEMEKLKFGTLPTDLKYPVYTEGNNDSALKKMTLPISAKYNELLKSNASMEVSMELLKDAGAYSKDIYAIDSEGAFATNDEMENIIFIEDGKIYWFLSNGNKVEHLIGTTSELVVKDDSMDIYNLDGGITSLVANMGFDTTSQETSKNIMVYYFYSGTDVKNINVSNDSSKGANFYFSRTANSKSDPLVDVLESESLISSYQNLEALEEISDIADSIQSGGSAENSPKNWIYKIVVKITDKTGDDIIRLQGFRKVVM